MKIELRLTDSLAKRLMNKDVVTFWKDVKNVNNRGGNVVASTVGGVTCEDKTAMCYDHYKSLLNFNQTNVQCTV